MDMIFSVKQLQEKLLEQHMPIYQVYVDLTKAFETVNHNAYNPQLIGVFTYICQHV